MIDNNVSTTSALSNATYSDQMNNLPFSFSAIVEKMQALTTEVSKLFKDARTEENRVSQIHRDTAKEEAVKAAASAKMAAIIDGVVGGVSSVVGMGGYLKAGFSRGANRLNDGGSLTRLKEKLRLGSGQEANELTKAETRQLRKFFQKNQTITEDFLKTANTGVAANVSEFAQRYKDFPLKHLLMDESGLSNAVTIAQRAQKAFLTPGTTQAYAAVSAALPGAGRAISGTQVEASSLATASSEQEKDMQRHTEKQRDESDQNEKSMLAEHRQAVNAMAQAVAQTINSVSGKF